MMLLETAVSATFILSLGLTLVAVSPGMSAAAKHSLCAASLGVILFLPVLSAVPFARPPALVNVTIEPGSVLLDGEISTWWMVAIWSIGAGFVTLRFAAGIVYLAWLTRRASVAARGLASADIDVRYAGVSTPLMWGWFRPTILLPVSFCDWTTELKKAALDHELAHIYRRDSWTALLATAAQAMYWFHPLVWWMSKKLVEQRESAADDYVLSSGTDAALYADSLVNLARNTRSPSLFGCAMVSGSLRSRVQHVLAPRSAARGLGSRFRTSCSIAILLTAALVVPARAHLSDKIYPIGGDVAAPRLVRKVEPNYTKKARREKTQGTVLLGVVIGKDGKARSVNVERSLTPDLDRQAMRAVSSWRFKPAMKAGQPVSVQAKVEVNFRLL